VPWLLVAQGVDVVDRLPTTPEYGGDIDQALAAVMLRDEPTTDQRAAEFGSRARLGPPRSRTETPPAWATTPTPSPETDRPAAPTTYSSSGKCLPVRAPC